MFFFEVLIIYFRIYEKLAVHPSHGILCFGFLNVFIMQSKHKVLMRDFDNIRHLYIECLKFTIILFVWFVVLERVNAAILL